MFKGKLKINMIFNKIQKTIKKNKERSFYSLKKRKM